MILTGTRQEALDAVAAACPGRSTVMTCNLGDADAVAGLIDAATEKAGAMSISSSIMPGSPVTG